jgi:hypothetical protein
VLYRNEADLLGNFILWTQPANRRAPGDEPVARATRATPATPDLLQRYSGPGGYGPAILRKLAASGERIVTNKAGMSLMHKDLGKYVDARASLAPSTLLTAAFLAPDFCSFDERSRNVVDVQIVEDLTLDSRSLTDGPSAVTSLWCGAEACLRKFYVNEHASRERMATNEAGMLLMHNDLGGYVGNRAVNAGDDDTKGDLLAPAGHRQSEQGEQSAFGRHRSRFLGPGRHRPSVRLRSGRLSSVEASE